MQPCQGWDGGPIPLVRSIGKSARTFRVLINNWSRNGLVFLCFRKLSYYEKERMETMVNIIKEEIILDEPLKKSYWKKLVKR